MICLSRKEKINSFWFEVGVNCLFVLREYVSLLLLSFSVLPVGVWSMVIILVGVCLEEFFLCVPMLVRVYFVWFDWVIV